MKKILARIGIALGILIVIIVIAGMRGYASAMKVTEHPLDRQLLFVEGGGGNSIVLTSEDGSRALVVDTKMGGKAAAVLAAKVKDKDVVVVNTHNHLDYTGGNRHFAHATLIAGAYTPEQWKAVAKGCRYPDRVVSAGTDTVIEIGSERVHLRNMGQAHTWDDLVVWLEHRNLLVTGDVVFNHINPAMFASGGTNAAAWMAVLDTLIAEYPACTLIPGHGDKADATLLHDMLSYLTDISDAVKTGKDIDSIKTKYASYGSIPMLTGFDKTVAFVKNEQAGKK